MGNNEVMSFHINNWKKSTPWKIKRIGDICVYSLPMWQALVVGSPFNDKTKLWLNFIIGALLIVAKVITKMFSEDAGNECNGKFDK